MTTFQGLVNEYNTYTFAFGCFSHMLLQYKDKQIKKINELIYN